MATYWFVQIVPVLAIGSSFSWLLCPMTCFYHGLVCLSTSLPPGTPLCCRFSLHLFYPTPFSKDPWLLLLKNSFRKQELHANSLLLLKIKIMTTVCMDYHVWTGACIPLQCYFHQSSCFLVSLTDLPVIASSSLRDLNIVLFTKSSLPLALLLNYLCLINSYLFFIFMFVSMFFGGGIQLLFHCIFNDHWYPHTFCHLQPPPPPTGIKIPFSGKPVRTTISTQIRYPLWNFDICIISYILPQCYLSHFSVLYQFILLFD